MNRFFIVLGVGVLAAAIDALPMIVRKMPALQVASAAAQCLVVALLVFYTVLPMPDILKGVIVSIACAAPILLLLAQSDRSALPPVIIMQLILGAADGAAFWLARSKGWI